MERTKSSDRERLLKLIDNDKAAWKEVSRSQAVSKFRDRFFSFFRLSRSGVPSDFRLITAALFFILIGVVSYIGWDLFHTAPSVEKVAVAEPEVLVAEGTEDGLSAEVPIHEDYLAAAGSADLFNPERIKAGRAVTDSNYQVDVSTLKLVGVDWGDHPVALVEDLEVKKTFFVKAGDLIKGFKVTEVFRDKVILIVGDQSIELK